MSLTNSLAAAVLLILPGTLLAESSLTTHEMPKSTGRFVRIELEGKKRPLRLAEVEIYADGKNIALSKPATQSSIFSQIYKYEAGVAVDLGRGSNTGSYTTNEDNPWWEVDLGSEHPIEKIILYKSSKNLDNLSLSILDTERNTVFSTSEIPQSDQIVFLPKNLGSIWMIGDQTFQGDRDNDPESSPRSVLFDQLTASGYTVSFTGHTNTNPEGLPTDDAHIFHSGISGAKIAQMTQHLRALWTQGRLATEKPETICVMIGTNDIGDGEIDGTSERLSALIDQIYALPDVGEPRIFLSAIPPNRRIEAQKTDTIIFNEAVQNVVNSFRSAGKNITFVNQFRPLDESFEFTMNADNFAPNGVGNETIGTELFKAIDQALALDFTDSEPMLFPGVRSVVEFAPEYRQYDVTIPDTDITFSIIPPKEGVTHASGKKPWLWRNIFYGSNTGQSLLTDVALLEEGYHSVNVYGSVSGHPDGNKKIKAVYDYLNQEHDFAPTFSASCMSRGGFMVFTYANAFPEQIESIYMDNACANALSWPAGTPYAGHLEYAPGKSYSGNGSKASFEMHLKAYGFSTFEEAVGFYETQGSPIHLLEPLAKAGVPILSICGANDPAVPYAENDALLKERYRKLGGKMTVIVENKGHSHGPKEPGNKERLLDFIREHTFRAPAAP